MSVAGWTGHVVVCGLDGDGVRVVEQLHTAGVAVVVVDERPAPSLLAVVADLGVPVVLGDSRAPSVLLDAGLTGAEALVCAASDDLRTLATALLVRELRADVRVVVALRNAGVGRALSSIGVAVLDTAGLAAPAVVEACLQPGSHPLDLGGERFVVVDSVSPRDGTLRELYGDLAPIAVVRRGSAHVDVAPGRDHRVREGDTAVVVGTVRAIEDAGLLPGSDLPADPAFVGARAYREPRQKPKALLSYLLSTLDRRVKLVLLALLCLVIVSVVVLTAGYVEADGRRMSVLDALYFTIETIGTVGFGDFYFRDQTTWLRVWAIGLMVIGATMLTSFFALLTNVLISRTLEQSLGRRKVTGLSEHVIVVGLGAVGLAVVERLRAEGTDVVVVEADEDNRFLGALRQHDTPVVIADATLPATYALVRLEHARAVAVMTSDDLVNIETGLAVRDLLGDRWSDVPVVLRLFDRRLANTVAGSFDFRYVRSTAALASPWFVGAALGLDVLGTFYIGDQPLLVASLPVPPGSRLDGLAMREIGAAIRVVSLVRRDGSALHPPRRDTRFAAGDTAYLVGPYEELISALRGS